MDSLFHLWKLFKNEKNKLFLSWLYFHFPSFLISFSYRFYNPYEILTGGKSNKLILIFLILYYYYIKFLVLY